MPKALSRAEGMEEGTLTDPTDPTDSTDSTDSFPPPRSTEPFALTGSQRPIRSGPPGSERQHPLPEQPTEPVQPRHPLLPYARGTGTPQRDASQVRVPAASCRLVFFLRHPEPPAAQHANRDYGCIVIVGT
jgi:hypothetical protein